MAHAAGRVMLLGIMGLACNTPRPARRAGVSGRGPVGHVLLVSIDGLRPDTLRDADRIGLVIPTLRGLAAAGATTTGARSVFPSVTYPAHASIATGAEPGRHGIVSNRSPDPHHANLDGWRWYAEDFRVEPLWEAVERAGGTAAITTWPTTAGARATIVVPEMWRAGTADDAKLLRALATPGVLEATAARFPGFWDRHSPRHYVDEGQFDVAVHVIETARPSLLMLHVWDLDHEQHEHGHESPEAKHAIEVVDAQLARLIAASRRAGTWDRTVLVVASDHGFQTIAREVHLEALLVEEGILVPDDKGRIAEPSVRVMSDGGIATVYAEGLPAASGPALAKLRARLALEAAAPVPWIARILEPGEVTELGGDPGVAFAVEAVPDAIFEGGLGLPVVRPRSGGSHGWSPENPAMNATLLMGGPPIAAQALGQVALVDIAPTIAGWLGAALPDATGHALPVRLR